MEFGRVRSSLILTQNQSEITLHEIVEDTSESSLIPAAVRWRPCETAPRRLKSALKLPNTCGPMRAKDSFTAASDEHKSEELFHYCFMISAIRQHSGATQDPDEGNRLNHKGSIHLH